MDLEHWYRCSVCGYMYTPQQVQALIHLLASRSGGQDAALMDAIPESIPCRKKGCEGYLRPTDQVHRDPRR
jgi:hypothetical protein